MSALTGSRDVELNHGRAKSATPALGDAVVVLGFVVLAAALTTVGFEILGSTLWSARSFNVWFQGDAPRVIANFTDLTKSFYRTSVHPIAPVVTTSFVRFLELVGLSPAAAAKGLMYGVACLGPAIFYCALRLHGLPRLVAIVFTAVLITSAAFIYWAPAPELAMSAMVTIVVALAALAYKGELGLLTWIAISALTLSVTITNWTVGLIASFRKLPFFRFAKVSAAALALVMVISTVQYHVLPMAYRFYTGGARHETDYFEFGPIAAVRSIFVTTISAPASMVEVQDGDEVVTNQKSGLFDRTPAGIAVATAWLAVLGAGVWGGIRTFAVSPVPLGLAMMIAFQVVLHCLYGDPTIMYAPHFLPMIVMTAALSWFTPARWPALALAAFVAVAGGVDNFGQFKAAAALAQQVMDEGGNPVRGGYVAGGALLP
jgi:hypothetical protein